MDFYAEQQDDYKNLTDDTAKTEHKKNMWEQFRSLILMWTCDRKKYGSLIRRLESQYSTKEDNYPKSFDDAVLVLQTHRFDKEYYEAKKRKKEKQDKRDEDGGTSFMQKKTTKFKDLICHCCGKKGHIAPKCPERDTIPRDQWYKERVFQQHIEDRFSDDTSHAPSEADSDDESVASTATNQSTTSTNTQSSRRSRSRSSRRATTRTGVFSGFQCEKSQECMECMSTTEHNHKQADTGETLAQQVARFSDLLKVIIMDSGSTLHTFANPDFVINIGKAKNGINMATNGGTKRMNVTGEVPEIDEVWFDATNVANILSLNLLRKKYRVTYDSDIKNSFFVHIEDGMIIEFRGTPEGLYAFRPSKQFLDAVAKAKGMLPKKESFTQLDTIEESDDEDDDELPGLVKSECDDSSVDSSDDYQAEFYTMEEKEEITHVEHVHVISTVEERRHNLTPRQYQRALRARRLYSQIGRPTIENFKHILKANMIRNCPVTIKDVEMAEELFGPDVGALKGRSKRSKPVPVVEDEIEIPKEIRDQHQDVTLCIDIFFINNAILFHGIDTTIKFRGTIPLKSRKSSEIYSALDTLLRHYNKAGHQVIEIRCDGEFKHLFEKIADDMDVRMNYTTADEHEPTVENSIKVVKERTRATYNMLPYKRDSESDDRSSRQGRDTEVELFPSQEWCFELL